MISVGVIDSVLSPSLSLLSRFSAEQESGPHGRQTSLKDTDTPTETMAD